MRILEIKASERKENWHNLSLLLYQIVDFPERVDHRIKI